MITLTDILRVINYRLESIGYNVQSHDVEKGFKRPVFYTELDNIEFSDNTTQRTTSCTARITFFPSDRYEYRLEILNVMTAIRERFDLKLKVEDRYLDIVQLNHDTVDGVLHVWFDTSFTVARQTEWSEDDWRGDGADDGVVETMDELTFTITTKGDER